LPCSSCRKPPAVLEKLRADWRRGRALKFIRLGEDWTFEYKTKTAGSIMLLLRFDAEGDTLVLTIREMYAKAVLGPKGPHVAHMGIGAIREFLEWVAEMARDLGYTRLRAGGRRTKGRRGFQNFEFDLDHYYRRPRPRR
jgi:hypothetical protein